MRYLIILFVLLLSCKKNPDNFSELTPYIGKYKAVSWVEVVELQNLPQHTFEITPDYKVILKAKGSPYKEKGKILEIQTVNTTFDKYFNLKLPGNNKGVSFGINSDTIVMGLSFTSVNKFSSPINFVRQ